MEDQEASTFYSRRYLTLFYNENIMEHLLVWVHARGCLDIVEKLIRRQLLVLWVRGDSYSISCVHFMMGICGSEGKEAGWGRGRTQCPWVRGMLGVGWPYRTDQVGMNGLHLYNPLWWVLDVGCPGRKPSLELEFLQLKLSPKKVGSGGCLLESLPDYGWISSFLKGDLDITGSTTLSYQLLFFHTS